jgi:hypothetical protein
MKLLKQLYIQVLIGLAAAGFTFSVFYGSLIPALVGITVAVIGPSSIRPSFYVMPSRFLTGAAAAVGMAGTLVIPVRLTISLKFIVKEE